MDLLDLFYKVLAESDNMSVAIEAVKNELLKRKMSVLKTHESYELLKSRHNTLVALENKLRKIKKLKNNNLY